MPWSARRTRRGAGLLVMGGYGRTRLSELVLGGVTRHVLQSRRPAGADGALNGSGHPTAALPLSAELIRVDAVFAAAHPAEILSYDLPAL